MACRPAPASTAKRRRVSSQTQEAHIISKPTKRVTRSTAGRSPLSRRSQEQYYKASNHLSLIDRPLKRRRHDEDPAAQPSEAPPIKRLRRTGDGISLEHSPEAFVSSHLSAERGEAIHYWLDNGTWPQNYGMNHLLARRSSTASLRRKRSDPSIARSNAAESMASDEKPREEKSAPYRNPSYPTFLSDVINYKSYMEDHELGLSDISKELVEKLLQTPQTPPNNTLFRDGVLKKHLAKLQGKNESRILQDVSPLLVPSAETLCSLGAEDLDGITESVNEGWTNCFPITKPRPQPDSAFGYAKSSFSEDQLDKLRPALGDARSYSYFKATFYMHFPFLTKEVKTGSMGLDIADNQNAHSMTIAVRAIVELFKLVGREEELHREVVAFAVSHDDQSVRLYAYYPFIDGDKVTIWRHTIKRYYLDDDTVWKAWTFTRNIYEIFCPQNIRRIRSAIDGIPPYQLSAARSSSQSVNPGSTSDSFGLSQHLQDHNLSEIVEGSSNGLTVTPDTSIRSEPLSPPSPQRKKSRRKLANH